MVVVTVRKVVMAELQIADKEDRLFPPHVMSMFNFKFPTLPIGHTHTLSLSTTMKLPFSTLCNTESSSLLSLLS
ncbi:uncharacterized protein LOC110227372 [Arabidopsis lyrata subsp. lyrata]|uniref:uncharacterized protein LOC110227372 n=1 Tax=Arabidopsis lyrata subsp. lyrata TaxID=81972 RepID=UPI000A29BFD9|nr:uncharacterized protein LOC110227372 [Arabidopsis lyrata subsp. lyrata]|eukprot:XP_020877118.1 uncharacterized protein LOC110227372 [Arabidopsis lyrata subsp. lyrata]